MVDYFIPLCYFFTNASRVSGGMLVARGGAKRNPGLGMWHEEPSAGEFSEMSLLVFRTEGGNKDGEIHTNKSALAGVICVY